MNATTTITRTAAGTLTTRPTITRHGVTRRTTFTPAPAPRDLTATARDNEPSVRRFLDSIGVHPIAAIRYTRDGLGTHATCTVLAYPERSAA